MLWLIGIGISGFNSITLETCKILEKADIVYLEQFTSPIKEEDLEKIKNMTKGEFVLTKRWFVEDGREILEKAKEKTVALLSYGDPYIATTHIELRTRAITENITTKTIHSASAITSMVGECGLQFYKIGRVVTVMDDKKSVTTPYYVIYRNLIEGNHTIVLLEFNQNKDFFLKPNTALQYLLDTEDGQRRNVINESTFVIVASRIGLEGQEITSGKISSLITNDFGAPPHSIIIPGKLHFTEEDALKVLTKCSDEPKEGNSIKKISSQMIEKYVPMVREALEEIIPFYKDSKIHQDILENAELYIKDAEEFLIKGKEDNAVLSIGYADGLVDALRMAKGIDPKM